MSAKKKPAKKYDLTQPTVTIALKHPFLWGSRQVHDITLRTAAFVFDLEEMDSEPADEQNKRLVRLIAALSDVDRDGKGIPHKVLSDKLRASDYMKLAALAGEILTPDESDEDESDEDPKKSALETFQVIGGTSQQ